jgi:signal transduction histidine kinase
LVQQRTSELVDARDQAHAANKAKSSFLANMRHELRTPLNAILGFSSLVRDDPGLSEKHRNDLEIVNRSGEHLLSLIDDMLDVAKIEAGRVLLENATCDLHRLVRDTFEMMHPRADEKNLKLIVEVSPAVPRLVLSDAPKLRQILINLIGNAVKYTQQGSVVVNVAAESADQSNVFRLILEVTGNGIGIAPADHVRIFDPFVQAGNRGARMGTGLGLAITRKFVELMGGSIRVDSVLGQGSTFRADLPFERVVDSEVSVHEEDSKRVVALAPGQPEFSRAGG